jgi:hypothetical protein
MAVSIYRVLFYGCSYGQI